MVNHDYCPVCSNYLVVRTKYKFSIFSVVTFLKSTFTKEVFTVFFISCVCAWCILTHLILQCIFGYSTLLVRNKHSIPNIRMKFLQHG